MVKKLKRQEAIYARQSVDKKESVSIETHTGRGQRKICSNSFAGLKLSIVQNAVATEIQTYLNGIMQT